MEKLRHQISEIKDIEVSKISQIDISGRKITDLLIKYIRDITHVHNHNRHSKGPDLSMG